MKTAIVHDWLTGMRGGEKCLEVFCELYPEADLHTLLHRPGHLSDPIEGMKIRTSWIQKLPRWEIYYRHLLPLFPSAVESFDFNGYDLVLSSSHCVAKGAVTGPETLHICYCYTPMRYAWDQYSSYFRRERLSWWSRPFIPALIGRLRSWDRATANRVDTYVAISHYVAERIERCYGRKAVVIHPPVDLGTFSVSTSPGDYYLMVNALAPYKRIDLAIEAFNRLGRELRIVGTGQDRGRLERLSGKNITFLGWLPPEELSLQYRGCRALIFPGEEDFGITPLEAQACGRPVIAYGRGGVVETVVPHSGFGGQVASPKEGEPSGLFFTTQDSSSIIEAVRFFENHDGDFSPAAIRNSVISFDRPRFIERFRSFVEEEYDRFSRRRRP